jgi:hypothetical protein
LPAPIPIPEPTKQELLEAANQVCEENCAWIDASNLPSDEKVAMKDREHQLLSSTIQKIFDQA